VGLCWAENSNTTELSKTPVSTLLPIMQSLDKMMIHNSDNNKSTAGFSTSSSLDGALHPLCKEGSDMQHDCVVQNAAADEKGALHPKQSLAPIGSSRRTPTRPVRFGVVRIREYGVTVGAYAAANDSCPLQLTWEYSPQETCLHVDEHQVRVSEGSGSGSGSGSGGGAWGKSLQPLSPNARRSRIACVQGTTNLMIARLERDLALELIQETIDSLDVLRRRGGPNDAAAWSKPQKMTTAPPTRRNRLAHCADLLDKVGRLQLE
jgi:hypothetical protein